MTTPADVLDAFRLSLRSLDVASTRVLATYASDDIDAAAVEAHFGLHAAYDLYEVFFNHIHPLAGGDRRENIKRQDDVLEDLGGQALGALAAARGAHTHHMISFAGGGGWPSSVQGMPPGTRGWVWAPHDWQDQRFSRRSEWYAAHVAKRLLHTTLDTVSCWATGLYWTYVEEHGLQDLAQNRRERADPDFT